ncbi:MAG: potassium channel family protein [Burkholderiales bacterium]
MRRSAPVLHLGLRGLTRLPRRDGGAGETQWRWEWVVLPALVGSIPAFYMELLETGSSLFAALLYAFAAVTLSVALWHTGRRTGTPRRHLRDNSFDLLLAVALLLAAIIPASATSGVALTLRLGAAALTLLRLMWSLQPALRRGSLAWLLLLALAVLGVCGAGFWWLEPRTPSFGDGLWLAFTTAATVGYGDIVPSTPASKIFAVFVVLLGFAVLSLVTAAIAAMWVESHERRMEHDILRDLHRQVQALRDDIAALHRDRGTRESGS